MKILFRSYSYTLLAILALSISFYSCSRKLILDENPVSIGPVFQNGEAQIVPEFSNPDRWIQHDLWVETEFDTDGDGKFDRMHVDVTRPEQTDLSDLQLPVIYETSPYFAGTAVNSREYFWDVRQELGTPPPARKHPPAIKYRGDKMRPLIST